MKKIIISTLFSVVYVFCAALEVNRDIFGEWFGDEKDAVVTSYKDWYIQLAVRRTWLEEPLDSKGRC